MDPHKWMTSALGADHDDSEAVPGETPSIDTDQTDVGIMDAHAWMTSAIDVEETAAGDEANGRDHKQPHLIPVEDLKREWDEMHQEQEVRARRSQEKANAALRRMGASARRHIGLNLHMMVPRLPMCGLPWMF